MLNGKIQRYFRHGTLTRLRVFEAVVRHGNSTRAAEALHMAQPTVSVHLRKLTDTIGVTLLEHVGKKVRLTAAGEEVYAACQRLFQTLSELDEAIADIRGLKAGKLRIATTTAGEYLLPPLLAEFVKRHPAIEVSLHVTSREAVLERLSRDTDDVYLLTNAPENNAIAAHAILPNPLIALAPAGHPLGDEKNIPFERFAKEPLLVRDQGSGTRLAVDRLFAEHELQPLVRMELGSKTKRSRKRSSPDWAFHSCIGTRAASTSTTASHCSTCAACRATEAGSSCSRLRNGSHSSRKPSSSSRARKRGGYSQRARRSKATKRPTSRTHWRAAEFQDDTELNCAVQL